MVWVLELGGVGWGSRGIEKGVGVEIRKFVYEGNFFLFFYCL